MKRILFMTLIFFMFTPMLEAQRRIEGIVKDAETGKALAFADVFTDSRHGVITDYDGRFRLEIPENANILHVKYLGYKEQAVALKPGQKFYEIRLQPQAESLDAVEISADYTDPAVLLIRRAVARKKANNYLNAGIPYTYKKYIRMLVSADTSAIDRVWDTVKVVRLSSEGEKTVKVMVDSSLYELKNELKDKYLWMYELLAEVTGKGGKEKSKVLAVRTAGMKKPVYELLLAQMSNQNLYDDYYKWLLMPYLGPFSKISEKQYDYEIEDTIRMQGREVIELSFRNKKDPPVIGRMYLDKESLAIAGMELNTYKMVQFNGRYLFRYYPQTDKWFPSGVHIKLKKADADAVAFGQFIRVISGEKDTTVTKAGDTIIKRHSNPATVFDYLYVDYEMKVKNLQWNPAHQPRIRYAMESDPAAFRRDSSYWAENVPESVDPKAFRTYAVIDSLAKEDNIDYMLRRKKKILYGYLPLGRYVDMDYFRLLDYNRYEGFRLNLIFQTTEYFSGKWQLNAYAGYGFRDKALKYGGGLRYLLHYETQTYAGLSYKHDLQKAAFLSPWLYPRGMNWALIHTGMEKFVMQDGWTASVSHLLTPTALLEVSYTKARMTPLFTDPRMTHPGAGNMQWLRAGLEWEPFSEFALTDEGRKTVRRVYPVFYIGMEQGRGDHAGGNGYYRLEWQSRWKKSFLNGQSAGLVLRAGYVSEGAPLYKWVAPYANGIPGPTVWKRFYTANDYAFQTLDDMELTGRLMLSAHMDYGFPGFRVSKKTRIPVHLIGRLAYVSIPGREGCAYGACASRYLGEAGLEFRRLFSSMGLGVYVRTGPYRYADYWRNVAVRLTIDTQRLFR